MSTLVETLKALLDGQTGTEIAEAFKSLGYVEKKKVVELFKLCDFAGVPGMFLNLFEQDMGPDEAKRDVLGGRLRARGYQE